MECSIGHAFLALLTGDEGHGKRAAALMVERSRVPPYGGEHGERFPRPVSLFPLAFDVGYDYLDADARETIAEKFRKFYDRFFVEWGAMGIFAVNRSVFPVPGMMGLCVLRDKGPFTLKRPRRPPPVVVLAPEEDIGSREGVPVTPFDAGCLVSRWLMIGPFDGAGDKDPLAPLGERIALKPQRGTAVQYRGVRFRFVPLPEDVVGEVAGPRKKTGYLVIPGAASDSVTVLFGHLEVNRRTHCLVDRAYTLGQRWSAIWINGRRIEDGTVATFEPGLHRVLIEVRGSVASPAFPAADAGAAEARMQKYEWLLREWQRAKEEHVSTGERQDVRLIYDMCCRGIRTFCLREVDRARRGEKCAGGAGVQFISACLMATGEGLMPDTPLVVAAYPEVIRSPRLDNRSLCFALGVAPEDLKPAVVAEFNRRFLPDRLEQLSCMELIAAYVNYPLDVTPGQ